MHQKNALVAAPISLARSMREQREIAWAMSTIRCKSFCKSVKGGINGLDIHLIKVDGISHGLEFFQEADLPTVCSGINDAL